MHARLDRRSHTGPHSDSLAITDFCIILESSHCHPNKLVLFCILPMKSWNMADHQIEIKVGVSYNNFTIKLMCIYLCLFLVLLKTFIHSFILETYIAPLQETTTQRRSQPSHGQNRRT